MEVKNSARRTRVFGAALALGLVIGAQAFFSAPGGVNEKMAPTSPRGEERRQSPEGEAELRSAPSSGISSRSTSAAANARAYAVKPTAQQLAKSWTQSTTRLKYLDRCQQSGTCKGFADDQPWSSDLDIRRQQASELRDFNQIALEWQEQHGGAYPDEAVKIARYFLLNGNDDVKEVALEMMQNAPVTSENLDACLRAIEGSASAPLMTDLMKSKMVAACSEASFAPRCVSFIKKAMRFGGEKLQKAFARHSLEITNERTVRVLAQIERQQDPRSEKRLFMRLNREEWQRMQRGG